MNDSRELSFDERGLIPAVLQSVEDGRVLMVAYMNREAFDKTLETKEAHFWSRSRQELWRKGATSGNVMKVVEIRADCDADCLLLKVEPAGPACHTGLESCFDATVVSEPSEDATSSLAETLTELRDVIRKRNVERPEGSYTAKLFNGGLDRITKKVGEEAVEVVIAGKNRDAGELVRESADLLYHLLVLWEEMDVDGSSVAAELHRRAGTRKETQNRP
jgi:phosphoribosyl-ATP pyrophosphohydrolase/phosphoribosyl-AMP cyclohydrolase